MTDRSVAPARAAAAAPAGAAELGRVLTAMITPFHPDGSVHTEAAGRLAAALLASGSDGVVLSGTTGECPALSIEEQIALWRGVRQAVGPGPVIVAGASTNSTSESLEMVEAGAAAGMTALMLTVPYYNKPPQEGMFRHFRALAAATPLPCVLYNIPSRTAVNMTAETTLRLAREVPNIVGVKEASGDLAQVGAVIDGAPAGFRVWAGDDAAAVDIVTRGGWGVVSVAAHLVGDQVAELVALAASGRVAEARALEQRLAPLFAALFVETNPIPVKYALGALGFPAGEPRLPLVPPAAALAERIRAELGRHALRLGDIPLRLEP